ncbi:MAG: hypothetical protein QM731_02970 [Chitinophagaceae bacterium]
MNTITICLIIVFFCSLAVYIIDRNIKGKAAAFYSVYTPNGLLLVRQLEILVHNNETLRFLGYIDLYQKMFNEKPESLHCFETAIGIEGHTELPENTLKSIAGQYFDDLTWTLAQRHRNQFETLYNYNEAEAREKFGLNIHTNEYVHEYVTKGVDWYEEKTVTTSINYGGYRFNSGRQGGNYTMGSLTVLKNAKSYFSFIDRGSLYITNKRLIFVGREKGQNRTIKIDDILEFSLFRDGILIGKPNGKKPLIEFAPYIIQPNKPTVQRDHLNRVIRALNRVINGTQNINLNEAE